MGPWNSSFAIVDVFFSLVKNKVERLVIPFNVIAISKNTSHSSNGIGDIVKGIEFEFLAFGLFEGFVNKELTTIVEDIRLFNELTQNYELSIVKLINHLNIGIVQLMLHERLNS